MSFETSESLSNELTSKLKVFAISDQGTRERKFSELIDYIKANLTKDVLDKLISIPNNLLLREAQEKVYSQVDVKTGKKLWTSSGTVIGLTETGEVWGFISDKPSKDILEKEYGDGNYNFYAPALIKSIALLHLDKSNIKPSLAKNINYLKNLGFPYHAGATASTVNDKKVYFGGSGCEVNQDFLFGVENRKKEGHFRLAGYWDERFCKTIIKFINNPNKSDNTSVAVPNARIRKPTFN